MTHDEARESLGAFVLDALPEDEDREVRSHVETCEHCRDEVASLRTAVDPLALAAPPVAPPPELKDRVMSVVTAEAQLLRAAGAEADRVEPRPRRTLPRLRLRPALAGAAAAALLAAVFASGIVVGDRGGGNDDGRTVAARITDPAVARTARASLRTEDGRTALVVRDLPPPGRGRTYELWLARPGRPPEPAGAAFAARSGEIEVPGELRGVSEVLVTNEPGRGSDTPTTDPLIVARLS
jgi:anti-sigma-K factor RskA